MDPRSTECGDVIEHVCDAPRSGQNEVMEIRFWNKNIGYLLTYSLQLDMSVRDMESHVLCHRDVLQQAKGRDLHRQWRTALTATMKSPRPVCVVVYATIILAARAIATSIALLGHLHT
nr:hypothetical protein CFP56_25927 [Quercus suber]